MAHKARKRSIFDKRGIVTAIIGTVVGGLILVAITTFLTYIFQHLHFYWK